MKKYQEALVEILFSASKLNDHIYGCDDVFDEYVDLIISNANSLQELVDKEKPMKVGKIQPLVVEEDIKNYGNARFNLCPKCKRIVHPFHLSDYSKIKYCENCGQKLDWSDEE